MLSAKEFTAGSLADAKPLSLMLPDGRSDEVILVVKSAAKAAALFIGGSHNFQFFECAEATNWHGLIIPNVRIEIDETSMLEANRLPTLGAAIRIDSRLVVKAKGDSGVAAVTVEQDLDLAINHQVAFARWRIVVGDIHDKRILCEIDVSSKSG